MKDFISQIFSGMLGGLLTSWLVGKFGYRTAIIVLLLIVLLLILAV